jgi:hypothetical protein
MDPRTEKMLAERGQKAASAPPTLKSPLRALNEVRTWTKAHGLAAKLGAGAIVVVLIAAHYVFVTMPAQRVERLQMEARAAERLKSETAASQVATDDCLSKASAEADARWNAACKTRRERAGCALPASLADELQRDESQARNACLMRSSLGTR